MKKVCSFKDCSKQYESKRSTSRYCSDTCRVNDNRTVKKKKKSGVNKQTKRPDKVKQRPQEANKPTVITPHIPTDTFRKRRHDEHPIDYAFAKNEWKKKQLIG